ncbi:MAG: nucleotidyltransferase domain-containing protein [Candidatus Nanohaloarchaea archaeon]
MEGSTLSQLLMKDKRLKVLNTLLRNRDRDFTISRLSDESGVGYKTTHGLVGKLENFGIIDVEEKGGSKIVSLNQDSPYIEALEGLGSIDSRPLKEVAEEYAEEVKEEYPEIETVALFGSVLNGLPTEESDIDILVLLEPDSDMEEVEEGVWAIRDRYEREKNVDISPIVMDRKTFELNAENREPFESKVRKQGEVLEGEPLG